MSLIRHSDPPKPTPPVRTPRRKPARLAPDDKCDSCQGQARFRVELVSRQLLDFCGPCWDHHSPALARQGAQIIQ